MNFDPTAHLNPKNHLALLNPKNLDPRQGVKTLGGLIGFGGGGNKPDPASAYPTPEHPGQWRQGHAASGSGGGMQPQGGMPPAPSFAPAGGGQGGGGFAPMAGQSPQFGPMAPGMQRRGVWPQGGAPMGQPMGGGGFQPAGMPGGMIDQNPMGQYGNPMDGRGDEMPDGGMQANNWIGDLGRGLFGSYGPKHPTNRTDLGRGNVNPAIQTIRNGGNYRA